MLVNLDALLKNAAESHSAVAAFNAYSAETIQGALQASQATGLPVIVALGQKYLDQMDVEEFVWLCKHLGGDNAPDFVIHLDHTKDLSVVYRALKAGFTSVMYDGSALAFDQNVEGTRRAVEVAHALGATVEAELGSLAAGENTQEGDTTSTENLTDPDEAAEFIRLTGVDALAISIGTVHGNYKGKPNIRLDVLEKIAQKVTAPLVLHGGSGTPDDVIDACIRGGITKINVNTEISSQTLAGVKDALEAGKISHLSDLSKLEVELVQSTCEAYLAQFNR